jgi:diguanylate cyclase (GGDEF)-like protein
MRQELAELKKQVQTNEKIWSGFRKIEIDAIGAETFHQLVHSITAGIKSTFRNVDEVSIACLNLDYEIVRIMAQRDVSYENKESLVIVSDSELFQWFPEPVQPLVGSCDVDTQQRLFPHCKRPVGSMAVSPLIVSGKLIGCLAQGSYDPQHFSAEVGTELLEHLSATIALCIRNTVNVARLERHGLTDPLTDIPNRRFLERRLEEEVERCRRYGHPLTCVMLDIDHFKTINDQYGHSVGDTVLKSVADALCKGLRASDILSRYGGEEFVLLLPETRLVHGAKIARRHHREINKLQFNMQDKRRVSVTVSAGVAVLEKSSSDTGGDLGQWLLQRSDQALYQAKRQGRNRVIVAK